MNDLIIANTSIRRDADGRYSLNDLHRAAGGENKHQPAFFMKRPETIELIQELSNSSPAKSLNPVEAEAGRYGGTWVVDQLVVAYAGWISARFHLEVINTFLAVKKAAVRKTGTHGVTGPVAREYRGLLSIAKMSGLKGNMAILAAANGTERLVGTNPLTLIGVTHLIAEQQERHYTPTELGKQYGESAIAFNKRLEVAGLQLKGINGEWTPAPNGEQYSIYMDTGKRRSDGTPVRQLKWLESVMDVLTRPGTQSA